MKKIIFISVIMLFTAFRLSAEKSSDVSLRYSRQDGTMRIVLESDDDLIKNTNVSSSLTSIKTDFPSAFDVRKPKDFIYETAKRDRSFYIFLRDVVEVKTSRLTGPARLVFDLKLSPKAQREAASKPEQKAFQPQGPLVSPGPQTAAPIAPPHPQPAQKQQPAPAKPPEKIHKKRVIVLDAGHGGYDYGIVFQDTREKDVNLALSRDLSAAMAKKGFTVFLDRKVDQSAPLNDRINFANSKNPDLTISIHAAAGNSFVVYVSALEDLNVDSAIKLYGPSSRQSIHLPRSKEAAHAIAASIKKDFDVGVVLRELPLPVLNYLNAPAIMIEYPSLKSYGSDQKMRDKLVASILKGVSVYEQ